MKILRLTILVLGLGLLVFALAGSMLALSAGPIAAEGKIQPRIFVLLGPLFFLVLCQVVLSIVFAHKCEASFGWYPAIVLFPLAAPLVLAYWYRPSAAMHPVEHGIPDGGRPADGKPFVLSDPPNKRWRSGVAASAVPGSTWKEVADGFCLNEAGKEAPDFPGLRKAVELFSPGERHGVWHAIGWKFRDSGDFGTANLCFLEGLIADPDPASANWTAFVFRPGSEGAGIAERLGRFPSAPTEVNRKAAAELVAILERELAVRKDSGVPVLSR